MGFTLSPPVAGNSGVIGWHETLRKWVNALNPVGVSVLDAQFAGGADPTGVADSAAAISACWTAAPAYSTIWYPPGSAGQATYKITSALSHPAKPLYHYAPRGGAVIKQTASGQNIFESNGADGWTIDGLVFDGNYPTKTSGRGLQLDGSTDFRMTNFRVQNASDMAIVVSAGCARFWLDHFTIDNTENSGIWFGEGTGTVEDFWVTDGWFTNTNVSDAAGHAGVQSAGYSGGTVTLDVRFGHFRDLIVDPISPNGVGFGMDYITDSEFINCEARGAHTEEAMALTGIRNRVYGGRYGESTAAAGLLLWCYTGNSQTNEDTIIQGCYLPGPGTGNQGIAIVPGANSFTAKKILISGVRAHGWTYGIQAYNGGKTGFADDGTVLIRDNHLTGNATGGYVFADITPVLRGNLTAADTIDA